MRLVGQRSAEPKLRFFVAAVGLSLLGHAFQAPPQCRTHHWTISSPKSLFFGRLKERHFVLA